MTTPQQELDTIRSYHSIFLDETGGPTPEGESVLRDLEKICGWMPKALPTVKDGSIDPLRIAADMEKRRIYAHIKERLFGSLEKIKRLTEQQT